MDNFGWSEQTTVLYYGSTLGILGIFTFVLFASIGPITKKINERKLMIGAGIVGYMVSFAVTLPIPGMTHPILKDHINMTLTISQPSQENNLINQSNMIMKRYVESSHLNNAR